MSLYQKRTNLVLIYILSAFIVFFILAFVQQVFANDSAAEIGIGGINFIKEENISIDREDLSISIDKIEVSYWFRNNTDKDISTVIAFPIPEYHYKIDHMPPFFSDFSVEVNGSFMKYEKEIKAFCDGKEYSALLNQLGISIIDFDGFDNEIDDKHFLKKLKPKDYELLTSYGLLDNGFPEWTVSLKYFWKQNFPPNSVTIIKHSYSPVVGYLSVGYSPKVIKDKTGYPLSNKTKQWIKKNKAIYYMNWVSYILTTANNWKKPIKEFNLFIKKNNRQHVVLSFEGKNVCESLQDIVLNIHDFIPKKDLMAFYLNPTEL
jgi:hypothetical protein